MPTLKPSFEDGSELGRRFSSFKDSMRSALALSLAWLAHPWQQPPQPVTKTHTPLRPKSITTRHFTVNEAGFLQLSLQDLAVLTPVVMASIGLYNWRNKFNKVEQPPPFTPDDVIQIAPPVVLPPPPEPLPDDLPEMTAAEPIEAVVDSEPTVEEMPVLEEELLPPPPPPQVEPLPNGVPIEAVVEPELPVEEVPVPQDLPPPPQVEQPSPDDVPALAAEAVVDTEPPPPVEEMPVAEDLPPPVEEMPVAEDLPPPVEEVEPVLPNDIPAETAEPVQAVDEPEPVQAVDEPEPPVEDIPVPETLKPPSAVTAAPPPSPEPVTLPEPPLKKMPSPVMAVATRFSPAMKLIPKVTAPEEDANMTTAAVTIPEPMPVENNRRFNNRRVLKWAAATLVVALVGGIYSVCTKPVFAFLV